MDFLNVIVANHNNFIKTNFYALIMSRLNSLSVYLFQTVEMENFQMQKSVLFLIMEIFKK
jgi:hypothetical protein